MTVPRPSLPVWKLDGRKPVRCEDFIEWAEWKGANPEAWIVAQGAVGDAWVSTVFVGTAPSGKPPALFETMIFGGVFDRQAWRYRTWEEAEQQHEHVMSTLRQIAEADADMDRVKQLTRQLRR